MFDFSQTFQDDIHQPFTWEGNGHVCAVLVHGFPGTPKEMRPIANVLHQAGWTVHALLLPGFGIEINDIADKTYTDWLSAVLNAVQFARTKADKIVLVGFSMGGALAIQACITANIDGLILLAPFWKIEHVLWTLLPAIKIVMPNFKPFTLFKPDFDDRDFRQNVQEWMPDANLDDPQVQEQILELTIPTNMINQIRIAGNQARQAVTHLTVPTTIIQGRQDELVKPDLTQILVQNIATDVNYILTEGDHNLTDTQKPHWPKIESYIHQYAINFETDNK